MFNHVKTCSTKKSKLKTLDELKRAVPIVQAMGVLHNVRSLDASDVLQKKTENDSNLPLWCSLFAGSARKTKSRKCHRFTVSQKQLMEECFDVGKKDKRKRHTTQSCQQSINQSINHSI